MTQLMQVNLSSVRTNPAALRAVNKGEEKFLELVQSVRTRGILNPVCLRELVDPKTGATTYGLIDGLHRYTAAIEAGLTEIPALITSMEDGEVEEAQIIANVHRKETKPAEYGRALVRMLARNPAMTKAELAAKLSKSVGWLDDILSLDNLIPECQTLVDEGKIPLSNAYSLAKLPADEQKTFAERAATMLAQQFLPIINTRLKELKDAKKQGRAAAPEVFTPVPHLRKMPELKAEMEQGVQAKTLLSKFKISTPEEAFAFALKWVVNLDPDSIEVQRANDEQRRAKEAKRREDAKAEREKKKQEQDAAKLASLDGTGHAVVAG